VRAYNLLGYTAAAVGNHEFDYGPVGPDATARKPGQDPVGALKKNAELAKFPFLSANMTEKATGRTPQWASPYTMVDVAGVKVGLIGISTPQTPVTTMPANVTALAFGDPVPAAVAAARELRAKGADAVVVLAHMGGRCTNVSDVSATSTCEPNQEAMEFLNKIPAGTIDAYFGGHTHAEMRHFVNGVAATPALAYSAEFSTIDLYVDPVTHHVDTAKTQIRPLTMICPSVYAGTETCDARLAPKGATLVPRTFEGQPIAADVKVAEVLKPYLDKVAVRRNEKLGVRVAAPIGRAYSGESALGNLLTDVMRQAYSADVAFMNSGGIRANLQPGEVTFGQIYEISPFDNYPAVVMMTGAQLSDMLRVTTGGGGGVLQVSGLRYTYDVALDAGKPAAERNRLIAVTLPNGDPLDPNKLYKVVLPDFLVNGGEGLSRMMKGVPPERVTIDMERTLHDVFASELPKFPQPLQAKVEGRITILNAPPARGGE
jgi:5'-nucleotidase